MYFLFTYYYLIHRILSLMLSMMGKVYFSECLMMWNQSWRWMTVRPIKIKQIFIQLKENIVGWISFFNNNPFWFWLFTVNLTRWRLDADVCGKPLFSFFCRVLEIFFSLSDIRTDRRKNLSVPLKTYQSHNFS